MDPECLIEKFNIKIQYLLVLPLELEVMLQVFSVLTVLGCSELLIQQIYLLLSPLCKLI